MTSNALREIARLAGEAGADAIAAEARELAERAAEGRFYVACVGQFKRGKSTLLNALVGADLLPTGVVPVTSVLTILRHGDLAARVRQVSGEWTEIHPARLSEYVSEEGNPGNEKGVLAVELFVPSRLLASGLCFVDTPGLGSVFEANTAATREFVPQIDAALVVLGADPPLSGPELALVAEMAREVDRLVFVLNKADRVSERERDEAVRFAQRVLSEHLGRTGDRVFQVSALERLAAGPGRGDWDALVGQLQTLAEQSGRSLVAHAARRGVVRLGARLQHVLTEEAATLRRPMAETEERLRRLWATAEEAHQALRDLGPLFAAEEQRLRQTFAARRVVFLDATLCEADTALVNAIRGSRERSGPALRRLAYQQANLIARGRIEPWLSESERRAEEAYQNADSRFVELANGLLARLRESEVWAALPLPLGLEGNERLLPKRRFSFYDFHHQASPAGLSPALRWLGDGVLPRAMVRRQIERAARAYLHRLLETNAARVENDLKERLQESRRTLEREIRTVLAESIRIAEQALERAKTTQAAGQEAVWIALARLESMQGRLDSLLAPHESPRACGPGG